MALPGQLREPRVHAGLSGWWSVLLGAVTAGLTAGSLPFVPQAVRDRIVVAGLAVTASWIVLAWRRTPPAIPGGAGEGKVALYATLSLCVFVAEVGPRLLLGDGAKLRLPLIVILDVTGWSAALLLLTAARLLTHHGRSREKTTGRI